MRKWSLLVLVVLATGMACTGQSRLGSFMQYGNIQALHGRSINTISETGNQTMWLGTSDGLVRFDGYRFITFYAGEGSITDNQVSTLLTDDQQNLWIGGNLHGISRYDSKTGRFRRWPVLFDSLTAHERVRCLTRTSDGQIWFATDLGIGRYNAATDSFDCFKPHAGVAPFVDLAVHKASRRHLWAITADSVFLLDIDSKTFVSKQPLNPPKTNGQTAFTSLDCDASGGIWLGTWSQGIYYLPPNGNKLEPLDLSAIRPAFDGHPVVLDIEAASDTSVLFACGSPGLLSFNPAKKEAKLLLHPSEGPAKPLDITSISNTTSGVWIGAIGQILQQHPAFVRLGVSQDFAFRKNEMSLIVSELAWDADQKIHLLACAGKAGMVMADEDLNHPKRLYGPGVLDSAFCDVARMPGGPWVALAYFTGRSYAINTTNATMRPIKLPIVEGERTEALEQDNTGRLWIATNRAVYCLGKDGKLTGRFSLENKTRSFDALRVYILRTDANGRAWLSSNQGIYRADISLNRLDHLSPLNAMGKAMSAELVKSMAVDHKNGIWLGYDGAGLQRMDGNNFRITDTWKADQLPSSSINHLCMTAGRKLLAATPAGLAALSKIDDDWVLYTTKDGLSTDFLDHPLLASPTGLVVVGTPDKVQIFQEKVLTQVQQPLALQLRACRINSNPWPLMDDSLPELKLSYEENNIDLEFSAMHWLYPMDTRYLYRMMGDNRDSSWKELSEPRLLLAQLQPGTYQLQLIARGAGGSKSQILTLKIYIQKPWWGQWWFMLLVIAILSSLVYGLHRYRIHQLLKVQQMQNRISKDLHDDIGSTLTSIQILSEVSRKTIENNPAKAGDMLQVISDQSKQVQQNMSDIVWAIRPDHDKLDNLVIRMREYIGQSFEPKNIAATLRYDESLLQQELPMEYRKEILLIYKEAMNNVLKHAEATTVVVALFKQEQYLHMQISDNGQWKPKSSSSGTGCYSMQQRAKQLGGTLTITPEEKGTTVGLRVPLP